MNLPIWIGQTTLVGVAALAIATLLRKHSPHVRLYWLQSVLALCLALPAIQPWHRETILLTGDSVGVSVSTGAARVVTPTTNWSELALLALAAGIALRFAWLGLGLLRLRRYRRNSTPLEPIDSAAWNLWSSESEIRECPSLSAPVTFGFRNPVILVPTTFRELSPARQEAVLCHEIQHVRRRDWLWMAAEELVRAVLWFHPAIWWLTAEIRIAREQVIDQEVLLFTRTKDDYVEALLAFASIPAWPFTPSAPGFIRRHHLHRRVIRIFQEVSMSRTRTLSTVFAATAALGAVTWLVSTSMPLQASPQVVADAPGVSIETGGAVILHRSAIGRNAATKAGSVTVQVSLDDKGNVTDASILSGPDELRKTVLQSVLNWHFAAGSGMVRQVTVNFNPQPLRVDSSTLVRSSSPATPTPQTVTSVDVRGLPEATKQELLASLPVHTGDTLTPELSQQIRAVAQKVDEHLAMNYRMTSPDKVELTLVTPEAIPIPETASVRPTAAPIGALRVGGNVQQANLIAKTTPLYPSLAKAARVQGVVKFDVVIGKDGHVVNVQLISGPPLLVQAGMEAIRQWIYKPTMLNGNPVEVATTVDVNFTLPDTPTSAPAAQ